MIVEAVIAVMILFGFVFIAMAKQSQEVKSIRGEQTFYDISSMLAEKAQTSNESRTWVFEGNLYAINSYLEKEAQMVNARLNVTVNITQQSNEPCSPGTNIPQDKEVYSSSAVISTDSITYNPKKLCIFVWER